MLLDVIFRGGLVVDGSGAPGCHADLGVKDGVIAEIGEIASSARLVIDATDRVVAPGFIDPHTHLAHPIMSHPDEPSITLGPEDDSRGMAFGGTSLVEVVVDSAVPVLYGQKH